MSASAHVLRRVATLTLLNLLAVLLLAQVEWNVVHLGDFGFSTGVQGTVHDVEPAGPTARAGIVAGDRVNLKAMKPTDRLALLFPLAGERVVLQVGTGASTREVTVAAAPREPTGLWGALRLYGYPLLVFITLCLATAIVLLRPGRPAWTYYAFVWFSTICAFQDYVYVEGHLWARLAVQGFFQFSWAGALLSLTLFSTRVFNPERRFQRRWEALIVSLLVIDFVVWVYFIFGYALDWWSSGLLIPILGGIADIVLTVAVIVVLSTMVERSHEESRERARWIVVGLSLQPLVMALNAVEGLLLEIFAHWSNALVFTPIYRLVEPWAAFVGALAVSYALVNEHIVDVRFAIGRASGYAITSAVLILFMTVCEWSVGELFADTHAAAYATLVAAILAAFSFNSIHRRIETLLDLAFFRREYVAEQRLKRDARALIFVTSERAVVDFLLDEPVEALELSSAALFKLDEDRAAYVSTAMRSWPEDAMIAIPLDDPLVAQLRSEREPLLLRDLGWKREDLPSGVLAPTLAVPALARSDLYAFVLYGAHRDGAALNPDERALLGTLVANAAATFDHLDAQQTREEIADLRRKLSESTRTG